MISTSNLPRYVLIEKKVGETPLSCIEAWRETEPALHGIPLAYAGRLDPMASGALLVLIGEECKVQEQYHGLDKEYVFEVLVGISSDSGDVLGIVSEGERLEPSTDTLHKILTELTGTITLPYPIFSSRTVKGKPLHTWTVEGRLSEIEIPLKTSEVYSLFLKKIRTSTRQAVYTEAREKIESLPPVTDPRKAIGNDFRRPEVRSSWSRFLEAGEATDTFTIATISCIASSGTYMRSLAEEIGRGLGTTALAFSIHRTKIGRYNKTSGDWDKTF